MKARSAASSTECICCFFTDKSISRQTGVKVKPRYVKTHQNVYRGVARDKDAAGGVNKTYQRESDALQSEVRDSHGNTRLSCPSILNVPNNSVKRKHDSSDSMDRNGAASLKPLLKNVQIPYPMRANYQKDYAPLAELGLERFVE